MFQKTIAVWPDGVWCEFGEVASFGSSRSDDFRRFHVPALLADEFVSYLADLAANGVTDETLRRLSMCGLSSV